jgi:hypothetical protein
MMTTSPATFSGLPAGRHHLRIVLEGYQGQEIDVEVKGGEVAMPEAIVLVAKPVVVKTEQFDGVWVMRPTKKDWGSTLTINGTTASITLEYSADLPRNSSGWEHFPAPYNKSPTIFYQWSAEATSVKVTSPTTIDVLWSEWKFSWEPHGLPYAILMRDYQRPKRMKAGAFDAAIPPSRDWGFVLKGNDLVSGDFIYHRRR